MAKMTIALSQKSGLLALVGRAACRGLLASPVGRVSAPSRFRLFGSRIDSQLYYLKSFKQEAGYLVEQELLVFFNPTLPHLGGVQ